MDYSSIFGVITKNVQARIDAASKLNKQLFDSAIYHTFLDWDTPSIGLVFEEIIGKYNISVAAATIGDGSKEPVLGQQGLETYTNKVLKHAISRSLTTSEYRKVLAIMNSKNLSQKEVVRQLTDIVWGTTEDAVKGVQAKIDMILLGALSNEGQFTFDDTNNPEGGVKGTINYNMPAGNIATATTEWTDANIESVNPFNDIVDLMDVANEKVALAHFLISPSKLAWLLKSPKMRAAVLGTNNAAAPLTLTALNNFMESNKMPTFMMIRRTCNVKKGDTIYPVTPWNSKNIVGVPAGKIGKLMNAYADSELRKEPNVTYSMYERIRISQWGVGEQQGTNGTEFTKAESLSLPVFTAINGIYTLKTEN